MSNTSNQLGAQRQDLRRRGMHWSRMLSACLLCLAYVASAAGQSVILPMPRLLTTMPMGGTAGTTVDVTITGQYLDGATSLSFSDPRITAEPIRDDQGNEVPNRYRVSIPAECSPGLVEARVHTRLGVSSPRVFSTIMGLAARMS